MTADRDRWQSIARRNETRLRDERAARGDILGELAQHVVTALRGAGYVEIHPQGTPPTRNQEGKTHV
ncbi:hypothetical protein HQQ80_06985 [Microbacteriaceae bacterium VKM Ac-2855]|nr:hypothetical protein [Microbacteriaceae bacterium VKM Ac-2855]